MEIKRFINGPFAVNSYLVYEGTTAVIIDPGHEISPLISFIKDNSLKPAAILLTHSHIDHIAGIPSINNAFPGLSRYLHEDDLDLLGHASFQAKMFSLPDPGAITSDKHLAHGESVHFGPLTFECIHAPGHSSGSLCFAIHGVVFTGDVIFYESIGRSDLFGGNHTQLISSIRERIMNLPPETILYPGHGDQTTVEHEKEHNPYL